MALRGTPKIILVVILLHNFQSLGMSLESLSSIPATSSLPQSENDVWERSLKQITNKSTQDLKRQLENVNVLGVHHRILTDSFLGGRRLVEVFEDEDGGVMDCNIFADKALITRVLELLPETMVTKVTTKELDEFIDRCVTGKHPGMKPKSVLDFAEDLFKMNFIFPGTKWCGAGDIAKHYDDLGAAAGTDKCCREHDHSNDSIGALTTKHGIFNHRLYTMTNCDDDSKFYDCLLKDGSTASLAVGNAYFNILKTECFSLTYPKVCVKRYWISVLLRRCKEYGLDLTKPKQWQIFQSRNFRKDFFKSKLKVLN